MKNRLGPPPSKRPGHQPGGIWRGKVAELAAGFAATEHSLEPAPLGQRQGVRDRTIDIVRRALSDVSLDTIKAHISAPVKEDSTDPAYRSVLRWDMVGVLRLAIRNIDYRDPSFAESVMAVAEQAIDAELSRESPGGVQPQTQAERRPAVVPAPAASIPEWWLEPIHGAAVQVACFHWWTTGKPDINRRGHIPDMVADDVRVALGPTPDAILKPEGQFTTGWLFRDYLGEHAAAIRNTTDDVAEAIAVMAREIAAGAMANPGLRFEPGK